MVGVIVDRYSFDVELFHLLLHAGLSRRSYNYSHPFPHVDEVTIAITPNDALRAS